MSLFKKSVCVLMAAALLLLTAVPAFAQKTDALPVVYIRGQGETIYSADGEVLYENSNVPVDDDMIADAVSQCMPLFINAVLFGRWDAYREKLLGYWKPVYEKLALNADGEIDNGSYVGWTWDKDNLAPDYVMNSYYFGSDWRLDPFDNAAILHEYIQDVKAATGAPQVNVVARCEGANIAVAYLAQYGSDDIRCLELYIPALEGIDMIGAAFSGEVVMTPDLLQTYYQNRVNLSDDSLTVFLDAMIDYLVTTYSADAVCDLIGRRLPVFYEEFINDMILSSYGMFPGIWSLVGPEYYAQARKNVFLGREAEYAGLLAKLDRYDRDVRQCYGDVLRQAEENGVRVAVIAKYGEYTYETPFCREAAADLLNDGSCSLAHASLGATCTERSRQMNEAELAAADMRYISPDMRVDASTCLFPDRTWFIYGCEHSNFPAAINALLRQFFASDGEMTVFDNESFPQYMTYTGSSIVPMTAEDAVIAGSQKEEFRFIAQIRRYFHMIASFFKMLSLLAGR